MNFFFDVCLLLKLRPLVENNIIKFSSEYLCLCSSCLDKLAKEEVSFGENMSLVEEILIEEYLDNVDYTVNYVDEEPFVEISGPEKYIIHGKSFVHFRNYIPDSIKGLAKKGRSIQLPKSAIIESGLLESLTSPIFEDLYHQNSLVNLYDISYLTNRDIDFDILNALHSKEDAQKSTNLMEGLTHLLPVLRDTSIEKIVNLRLKDGEAFSVYRDSLSSVVKGNHNYNSKELKGIFRDKINPELNKIEQTIKRNRKHLTGSIVKDIIFVSSIASIGLYSGLLPKDIGKIVAAVGGTRLLYDMYNKMGKALTSDEEIEKVHIIFYGSYKSNQLFLDFKHTSLANRGVFFDELF